MNYLTYPFKIMRITQSYTGTVTHLPHTTGTPKDWPIDEAGIDGGKDPYYCPCDEVKIVKIYGVGNKGVNTIWIESTTEVDFANGKKGIFCSQITHPNDSDIKSLKVGQKFKRGEIICHEGIDGAKGNHIHHSVGMGTCKTWVKNSNEKWVLSCSEGAMKPEDAFFIDPNFTTIKNSQGLNFKKLSIKKESSIYVTKCALNCRKDAGVKNERVLIYPKGKELSISSIKKVDDSKWGKTKDGWVSLNYCIKK